MVEEKMDIAESTKSPLSVTEIEERYGVDVTDSDNVRDKIIMTVSGYLQRQAERAEKQLNAQTQSNTVTNTEGFSNADSESPFIDGPSPAEEEENSVMHRGVHR